MKIEINMNNLTEEERVTYQKLVRKASAEEDTIWKPLVGEVFYYIDGDLDVRNCCKIDESDDFHSVKVSRGNVFKTRDAAQDMADRRKRIGIFENKMMEFSNGYKFTRRVTNYFIQWNPYEGWECEEDDCYYIPLNVYMSREKALKAVEWANKHFPEGL